jgi:hypothetical protein
MDNNHLVWRKCHRSSAIFDADEAGIDRRRRSVRFVSKADMARLEKLNVPGGGVQHFIAALDYTPVGSAQRNRRRSSKGR